MKNQAAEALSPLMTKSEETTPLEDAFSVLTIPQLFFVNTPQRVKPTSSLPKNVNDQLYLSLLKSA